MEQIPEWLKIMASIVGVFASISTVTPNKSDNALADTALRVINALAMNFGKAKNGE